MAQVDTDGLPCRKDAMTSALVAALYWIHKSWHCLASTPGRFFANRTPGEKRSDVKAKIRPGVEARHCYDEIIHQYLFLLLNF